MQSLEKHTPPFSDRSTPVMDMEVSLENTDDQATSRSMEPTSSPRISFSVDFLDDNDFISISPHSESPNRQETEKEKARFNVDFEFLSAANSTGNTMLTADELFFEGRLLPSWQMQHSEKLNKLSLKPKGTEKEEEGRGNNKEMMINKDQQDSRVSSWFIDDDPSPRPPKCTVLWKELLRLKKQRASTLSPSASSSSSSSLSSTASASSDVCPMDEEKDPKEGNKERLWNREKHIKRIKKGLERTRSASVRIRPVVHVPICTQTKISAFPPLFHLKKPNLDR
ncbi:PREDICTED: uncharacterized protein LOC104596490 [Nelumbo nucifera]|uniref:Uncharacterized protein n=2 Tax=Nelumbo nucifera TaxID=4432 RepID=A0A822XGY3_NELNU|nr:PREDICTED: uncharacterized protein LOC104596490 [Nelumbo nucifera]DAD19487.1 TPA_asm: hypothetical protein HUJ06_020950 [Nelumbo nucifera]